MRKINPFKPKYHSLYWEIADAAAQHSQASRLKVGAVIVAPTGMLSTGWNGQPAGFPNLCETPEGATHPYVIHAERNAIDKMTRQGISTEGSQLFVTHAPCLECAKQIHACGITAVHYLEEYRCNRGVEFLSLMGVSVNPD